MSQNPLYILTNRSKEEMNTAYTKVPILGPQQVQKLDKLRKIRSNSENTHPNLHRQSIRPNKSIKIVNLQNKSHDIPKQICIKDNQDSGITKEELYHSNETYSTRKNTRIARATQELDQKGIFDKYCPFFMAENKIPQSPYKTARNIVRKK